MADYRKRLIDMTDEERAAVAPGSPSFDERYENVGDPLSVQMMEAGLDFTPVGTVKGISDIKDELSSDDPNYLKAIGMGAVEAAALIPGAAPVLKGMLRKGDALTAASKQADVDQAAAILDSSDELKRWQEANKIPENKRQANTEKAQAAAEDLYQGDITSKEARQIIKEDLPITSLYTAESMPNMPTVTEVAGSLGKKVQKTGVVGVKGFDIPAGTRVGSRLDIPAYNNYDTWVVSIHDGKNDTKGSVLGYGQAVRLKNIKFGSESKEALNIARGKRTTTKGEEKPMGKATIARVYGDYVPEDPYVLQEQARKLLSDPEWTQVGMNPYRQSNFYDKNTGLPVFEADEVIQVGPLVLAKGVKKPTKTQLKELAVRTKDGKLRLFNEGGAVMDEQMEMAFGDAGERVDPVSGNEVPTGSLPEEVRDDIPAQLSEGEYVVPADVVRYYGVKFFEDLRSEAKTGFNQMQANGRIGGEPMGMEVVDPQDDLDIMFDDSDFEVTDGPDGYAEGGVVTPTDFGIYVPETMEMREYVNAEGNTITIMFFNGMPMSAIPEGYTYVNPEPDPATTGGAVTTAADVPSSSDDGPPVVPSSTVEPTNYKELTPSELQALVEEQRSMTQDVIAGIGGIVNPILGLAMKVGMWHTSRQVTKELERRIADPENADLKDKYAELLEYHESDTDSYYNRIMDTIEGKERDKLPFDIDAADPAAINAAIEEGLLAEEGYSPDNIDEMPTGMDPIAAPEPIELTSLNDEPGARDYKGPLAGLSSMLDTKGGLPEPYVFKPETPALSDNASAFLASEDKVIADQRREKIKERMAEKQAERQRKLDALQAQISAKDSLARAASNNNDSNDTHQTAVRAARAAADTRARNQAAGLGAQTKKGSTAGSKSGYFD